MNNEPNNINAEINVLGCGYLSNEALDKMCDSLTDDMFYDKKNQIIFSAMKSVHKRNENLDATVLKNEIEKVTPINNMINI